MTQNEQKHNFKNGSCLNCGIIEEHSEEEPCEKENTEWIFDQICGTRDSE